MNRLITFFLDNHKLTLILSLIFVVFGVMGLIKLNAESYPTVNFAMATIETRYDGATSKEVETKITKPIEDKIREVSGLKDVRSVSKSGFSSIFVRVDMDNEDEDQVLEDLQKAVDSVSDLPEDLREDPTYQEINSEEFPAIEIAVVGENTNRSRDIMADLLKEDLEDSKRVKNVRVVGWRKRQFNIRLNEQAMKIHHIGISEVLSKIRSRNIDVPGGDIEDDENIKRLIRVEGKVQNVDQLKELVVRSNFSGQKVLLKDIAKVEDSEEDGTVYAHYNGSPAVLLIVNKKGGADTLSLVDEVDKILKRYREQYKDQFQIFVYNNEAEKVKNKLDILNSNAVSGLILVVVFLFIFLPGRIGLMASLSLPLAVMATIGFMPSFGMNLDAITILALVIALGMLVDNSVVISENYTRLMNENKLTPIEAAKLSVQQLWLPITCTAFTTISAFLPMLVTKGIMGQFIKWIPIVVTISLLISLFESFFLLPMRLRFAGNKEYKKIDLGTKKNDWFHAFIEKFEAMMTKVLKRRYFMVLLFGVGILGSFLLMALGNKFILFPAEQTEIYVGRVENIRGSTLESTSDLLQKISKDVLQTMGDKVKWVTTRAGISKMGPTDPKGGTGDNQGLIMIYASKEAKYNVYYTDFLKQLRTVSLDDERVDLSFQELVNGPPVGEPINATFRSNDSQTLDLLLKDLMNELGKVKGVRDLKLDDIQGEDEIHVNIDYAKADRLGLSAAQIGDAVRTAMSGTMASKVTLKNKEVDLSVRYMDELRKTKEQISQIEVMDRLGNLVPLSTVATLEEREGSFEIKRFDFKRSKTLTGQVDEELITSQKANQLVKEFYDKLSSKYPGVSLVFGGQAEQTKESMQSLAEAGLLALMGIFGLLVFLFKSYLRPLIIMSTIPLGLIGFSIAFYFHNRPISFLALIGVIGLAGIIVNSGIVLISFIDQMREESDLKLEEILIKASGMRLRAVLVTSLTTISGLIPTAYGIGGSDAMLVPMTMAMAWGLTSGTVLTLIWVPCGYAILEDLDQFFKKLKHKIL